MGRSVESRGVTKPLLWPDRSAYLLFRSSTCMKYRKGIIYVRMRLRNDVCGNHLANFPSRGCAGVNGTAHRSNIAAHNCRHEACVNLLPANEAYVCPFYHRIRGLDHCYKTSTFNQTECFWHKGSSKVKMLAH